MLRLAVIVLLVVAVAAGFLWYTKQSPDIHFVDTTTVNSGSVVSVLSLSGELVNDRTVTITALVDGEITAVSAREGDIVKSGQSLAEQDPVTARALLDKAQAELVIANADAEDAQSKYTRADELWRRGDLSEQLYDESRMAQTKAEASVIVAQSTVTVASRAVRDATIRAPFDGQVVRQRTETGQWVEAGTPLFTLVATTGQVIEAYVDATDIASVAIDQAARLASDAWPDQHWQSKVDWIAPVIATSERSRSTDVPPNAIAVRLALGEDAPALRLGQQVDVELETARRDNVIRLPLNALRQGTSGGFEALTIVDGNVSVLPVTTGLVTLDMAEITDGISEGDVVISAGLGNLDAGMAVQAR